MVSTVQTPGESTPHYEIDTRSEEFSAQVCDEDGHVILSLTVRRRSDGWFPDIIDLWEKGVRVPSLLGSAFVPSQRMVPIPVEYDARNRARDYLRRLMPLFEARQKANEALRAFGEMGQL